MSLIPAKKSLFVIFFSFLYTACFAQVFNSHLFKLSVEPEFSYANGCLKEIIYQSGDKSKKRSLLEWEKKLWFYGANVDMSVKKLHFDLKLKGAANDISGQMRDSDWLSKTDYSMKTSYSWGDNISDQNYIAGFSIYYDLKISRQFSICPFAGIDYQYDSFYRERGAKGRYGEAAYSSDMKDHWWYEEEAKVFPSERYWSEEKQAYVRLQIAEIDYKKHSVYTWAGVKMKFEEDRFKFMLEACFSPYLYFSAEDKHHDSGDGMILHMIQDGCLAAFKTGIKAIFTVNEFLDLSCSLNYLDTKTLRGKIYYGWTAYPYQDSGASAREFLTGISATIKIF